jgi:VWFA-related protein
MSTMPRFPRSSRVRGAHALLLCFASAASIGAQQQPRFETSVDVTSIVDVVVVDNRGQPITGLGRGDFNVWIDGDERRVLSAEWVPVAESAKSGDLAYVPDGYTSNENDGTGRLIVIAVDQAGIRFGGTSGMMSTLTSFIDKLLPSDRVALVGFGPGAPPLSFSPNLARAKEIAARMTGLKQPGGPTTYNVGLGESLSIVRGELGMLDGAIARECVNMAPRTYAYSVCSTGVKDDAGQIARDALEQANTTITGLSDLFNSLKEIDGPKIVVLISEGFVVDDYQTFADSAALMAAAAQASLYVLHLNDTAFDQNSGRRAPSAIEDRRIGVVGMEALAKAARGSMFTINGAGTGVFERIQAEISGHYLVGVEPDRRDRDGKPHSLRIEVPWNGAVVRARKQMVAVSSPVNRGSPQERVAAGLSSPLPISALPLRVTTFALQGPETGKVQMLIHADVGKDFRASRRVSLGYSIVDQTGQQVDARQIENRLPPVMNGVPSALQFAAGASLSPGEYSIRLAAADGDRLGSVEHRFEAKLSDFGGVRLSDLMVGGPAAAREFLSPTIGYTVSFGSLHGYLEAYGEQADAVTVKYEVGTTPTSPALISADVAGRLFGDDRMIFTHVMSVQQLPPDRYVLRAQVSLAGRPLTTLTRPFEVAAASPGAPPPDTDRAPRDSDGDLFLPVDDETFLRPFRKEDALRPDVVAPFRDRLSGGARDAFDAGIKALSAGDYRKAEASLKSAVQPDVDSTSLFAYLAVVYAAANDPTQAIGAWQTALINGGEMPDIYAWLGQTLVRTRNLPTAQAVLEEANEKWPGDPRFTAPLASVYATFGRGRDAVLLLEQYLEKNRDDLEVARTGVEWLYQIHAAGRVVHSRSEDVTLARGWAARYGNGPRQALVRQWLDVLEREAR